MKCASCGNVRLLALPWGSVKGTLHGFAFSFVFLFFEFGQTGSGSLATTGAGRIACAGMTAYASIEQTSPRFSPPFTEALLSNYLLSPRERPP